MLYCIRAGYTEQIENSATELLERLEPLRTAAKSEAENLGHAVVQLVCIYLAFRIFLRATDIHNYYYIPF